MRKRRTVRKTLVGALNSQLVQMRGRGLFTGRDLCDQTVCDLQRTVGVLRSVPLGSCSPMRGVISEGSALCLSLEQLFDSINYRPTAAVVWHNLAF